MVGPYRIETLVNAFDNLRKMYGNIVRLNHRQEAVLLFDPYDIRAMYAVEGILPQRPTFEALKKYRNSCIKLLLKEKFACV